MNEVEKQILHKQIALSQAGKDPEKVRALAEVTVLADSVRMDMENRIWRAHREAVQGIIDKFREGAGADVAVKIREDARELKTWIVFDEKGDDRACVFSLQRTNAAGKIKYVTNCLLSLDGHTELLENVAGAITLHTQ